MIAQWGGWTENIPIECVIVVQFEQILPPDVESSSSWYLISN